MSEQGPGRAERAAAGKRRWSLASGGARVHFDVGIVLVSVLPLLVIMYCAATGRISAMAEDGMLRPILGVLALLVVLGHALLLRYPATIVRLRRYLESIARGDFRDEISLSGAESDIQAIQTYMQQIVDRLQQKVAAMALEQNRLADELCKAQKLESIGELVSGIAHEINTPIQFVGDNTRFLSRAVGDLLGLLKPYRALAKACRAAGGGNGALQAVEQAEQSADVPFLEKEAPEAISQSLDGLGHVANLCRALKDFARMVREQEPAPADLNQAVESAATLTRHEWKHVAELKTNLDPDLPPVPCLVSDIKQVLINLIVNSAHSVEEKLKGRASARGRIEVRTRRDDGHAVITVSDTGMGIPAAIQGRIFEPFFTTKKDGKGSGQGLAIARSIVLSRHGGDLTFRTEEGVGTAFDIRLPLSRARRGDALGGAPDGPDREGES